MKVRELIEQLKQQDQEQHVVLAVFLDNIDFPWIGEPFQVKAEVWSDLIAQVGEEVCVVIRGGDDSRDG